MRKLFCSALCSFLVLHSGISAADDFVDKFTALKKADDRAGIEKLIAAAATDEADNPDYYATVGNYWWGIAGTVAVTSIKEGEFTLDPEDFSISDPKTGKTVGAIGKAGKVDAELPKRALKLLSDGAKKFPERADIALGLAHIQREMKLQDAFVDTLVALLATAKKDPRRLKWTSGGKLPKAAETFLPETVQTYSGALFNANTPATDKLCGKLLDAVTNAFPEHPYAYNLKAALADATGNSKEAVKMLELAHEKAQTDPLILSNLAGAYVKAGEKQKAIESYQKLLKLKPSAKSRQHAELALKKLGETPPAN